MSEGEDQAGGVATTRPVCRHPGCQRLAMHKDNRDGKPRYRSLCQRHHRGSRPRMRHLNLGECALCGWRGSCHRHRLTAGADGGTYSPNNLQILCPNCHAAAHGQGEWNWPQSSPESNPCQFPT